MSEERRAGWASKLQRLTKAQRVALETLEEHGPIPARRFAELRWPQGFNRASNTGLRGHSTLIGAGASMKAGAFLQRLVALGLVEVEPQMGLADRRALPHYLVSETGRRELQEARERARKYGRPGPRGKRSA